MNELLKYLVNIVKFSGFCLVGVVFSHWVTIRIEHTSLEGKAIRVSHEGFNNPHVRLDLDHKFPPNTNLYHHHSGNIN